MKEKTRRIILSILTATCLCTCCNNEGSEQENHECTPTCDKNQECVNGECQVLSESSEENSERECDNDGVSVCDDNQVKTCKAGQFEYQNCTATGLTCETTDEGVACVAAEKPECTDNDTPVCEGTRSNRASTVNSSSKIAPKSVKTEPAFIALKPNASYG